MSLEPVQTAGIVDSRAFPDAGFAAAGTRDIITLIVPHPPDM